MKQLAIFFILLTQVCKAQEIQIDSCGLDNSPELNDFEVNYFNSELSTQCERLNFNFDNKKVGFAYGNFGGNIISKKEYFERWGRSYFNSNSHVVNQLIILNEEERTNSGGFDAVVVSWSKILVTDKPRTKLVKNLKKANI